MPLFQTLCSLVENNREVENNCAPVGDWMTVNHECSVVMRNASVKVECMRRYLKQREGNNNAIV